MAASQTRNETTMNDQMNRFERTILNRIDRTQSRIEVERAREDQAPTLEAPENLIPPRDNNGNAQPMSQHQFERVYRAIKLIQRRLDAVNFHNLSVQESMKQLIREGDLLHADLQTDYEDFYFIQEIKYKFITLPQINPDQIMDIES